MNDLVDAIVAGALGFGMWCFVDAPPEEPSADPPAAAVEATCEEGICENEADIGQPAVSAVRSDTERP